MLRVSCGCKPEKPSFKSPNLEKLLQLRGRPGAKRLAGHDYPNVWKWAWQLWLSRSEKKNWLMSKGRLMSIPHGGKAPNVRSKPVPFFLRKRILLQTRLTSLPRSTLSMLPLSWAGAEESINLKQPRVILLGRVMLLFFNLTGPALILRKDIWWFMILLRTQVKNQVLLLSFDVLSWQ